MAENAAAPAPRGPQIITSTVDSSEGAVLQTRNEIPIGVGGQPIERAPYNAQLAALLAAGTTIKRWAGQERCIRVVTLPLQGGTEGQFHCSRAAISAGVDGEKYCPEHDKAAFQPNQTHPPKNQKVFNSASIHLSDAERSVTYEKEGKKYTVDLEDGTDIGARRAAQDSHVIAPAPELPVKRARAPRGSAAPKRSYAPRGSGILIRLDVSELNSENMVDILRTKLVDAINALPAKNVSEMESVISVRERVKNELRREE
jgi:hypothetical protein